MGGLRFANPPYGLGSLVFRANAALGCKPGTLELESCNGVLGAVMFSRVLFAIVVVTVSTFAKADFASDFKEKVKAIEARYLELDKRANELLADRSKADFARYAELRNEVIRFVADPRREIIQARSLTDQNSSQRVQTEQELKILISEIRIDLTDDDGKPLPTSTIMPKIEAALVEAKQDLDRENASVSQIARDRVAKMTELRAQGISDADKQTLGADLRKITEDLTKARGSVSAAKQKNDQLRRAKELLTKTVEFSNFSLQFGPEVEKLEGLETRANQRIQQIDEAIFNFLLVESNDKRYTLYSTIVFGVAVVIVIGSFFFVAYKSEAIRASIFANDSGLQFVTLFSLVIAIILFGVLKILEGRELAALLGGLSGYILGRGGISRQPGGTAASPPPPPGPPAPAQPAGLPAGG
jgi:hypothetical protein